jgi:hypothetical protein
MTGGSNKSGAAALPWRGDAVEFTRRPDCEKDLAQPAIEDCHPHMCRHFATWHYQEHRDLNALMDIGGWKSELAASISATHARGGSRTYHKFHEQE